MILEIFIQMWRTETTTINLANVKSLKSSKFIISKFHFFMKTIKFLFLSILMTAFIGLTSCSYRLVDFTVISSKNHDIDIDLTKGKQVEGKSMGFLGLGASIKDAMDKALQSAGPEYDLLVNGVVRVNDYFLVGGYKVTGTAVSSRSLKAMLGEKEFEEWCKKNDIFDPFDTLVLE